MIASQGQRGSYHNPAGKLLQVGRRMRRGEKKLPPARHAVITRRWFRMTDVKNKKNVKKNIRQTRLTLRHALPEPCAFSPTLSLPDSHTLEQRREQKTKKQKTQGGCRRWRSDLKGLFSRGCVSSGKTVSTQRVQENSRCPSSLPPSLSLSLPFLGNGGEKLLASAQSHSAERRNRASGKRQRHTIDEEGGGGGIWGWHTRRRGGWEIAWGVGGRLRCFCGAGGVAEERFPPPLPLSLSSAAALKTTGLWGLQVTSTTSSTSSSTTTSTTTSAEIHQLRSHRCLFRETHRAKLNPQRTLKPSYLQE